MKGTYDDIFDLILKGIESGHSPIMDSVFHDAVLDFRESITNNDDLAVGAVAVLVDVIEACMLLGGKTTFTEQADWLETLRGATNELS